MDKVGFTCFPERITPVFKFFNTNQKHMMVGMITGTSKPPHVHTLGSDSLYYKHKRVNLVHLLKNTYSNL